MRIRSEFQQHIEMLDEVSKELLRNFFSCCIRKMIITQRVKEKSVKSYFYSVPKYKKPRIQFRYD